jgi:hypothetical protein
MSFEGNIILPTAHPQQNLTNQRDVVLVVGIDRDVCGGADGNLLARYVFIEIEDGEGPATLRPRPIVNKGS